jgi:hypothetical protein
VKLRRQGSAVIVLLAYMSAVDSHHAFAPVYDASRTITIAGTVTEFRLVNPHSTLVVDVVDDAGNVVNWTVELAGRLNLTVGGWTENSIAVGENVTVTGNPTHTGSHRMAFTELIHADGTRLRPPSSDRFEALEAERRQRAEQRSAE